MSLIQSLLIFYPLIIPIWESTPIDSNNIKRQESLPFLDNSDVTFQISSFKKIEDPHIRSQIVIDLVSANNPRAIDELINLYIYHTTNIVIKSDIIKTLYHLKHIKKCSNIAMLKECMKNSNDVLRGYGAGLYLDSTKDCRAILKLLKSEKSFFVKNLLWGDLILFAHLCDEQQLEELLTLQDFVTRARSAEVLSMIIKDPDSSQLLSKCAMDNEIFVRSSLAKGLSSRKSGEGIKLLSILAKDKAVQVRESVASAKSAKDREGMQIALTKDSDFEIRRLAVFSLKFYKTKKSINALLEAMNDPYKSVRSEVEKSLIFLKPSLDVLKIIGDKYLIQKPSISPAIKVLGVLKDKRFNKEFEKIVAINSDDDLICRAIDALGMNNVKNAAKVVAEKANNKNRAIRYSVAYALGVFAMRDYYSVLVELSKDENLVVSLEAIKSMGKIEDDYFIDRLMQILKDVSISANMRAAAAWSLARIGKPSPEAIALFKRNILSDIIPVPMGPPELDTYFARISYCLALVEFSKKDESAKTTIVDILKDLQVPIDLQGMKLLADETLQEYARQTDLYLKNEIIDKRALPTVRAHLTVDKYKK